MPASSCEFDLPDLQPLVSVVVPVYNGRTFVRETMESVRRQTYGNWELLVCDNHSSDDTRAWVRQDLENAPDPRIRLVEDEVLLPMAENWNRALGYARGPLLKLLPADDLLLPECLETQVRLLRENRDVGFVTSGKDIIDASGRKLFSRQPLRGGRYSWEEIGRRSLYAVANNLGEPGGVLFRRELLDLCGGYKPGLNYFVDIELLWRFLRQADAMVCGRPLYQFRIHGASTSAASRRKAVLEYFEMLDTVDVGTRLSSRPWLKWYLQAKAHLVAHGRALIFRALCR